MHIVTKLNIDINEVEIIHVEINENDENGYLQAWNELMDNLEFIKENEDIQRQILIIDSCRVEVFEKGYITGKSLKFVYSIIKYTDEDTTDTR